MIKRFVTSSGRVFYKNLETNKFASRSDWVKSNYDIIGKGRRNLIPLSDLDRKEKASFYSIRTNRQQYRYNGKFVSKEVSSVLKQLNLDPTKDVSKQLEKKKFEIINQKGSALLSSWYNEGARYETTKGQILSVVDKMLKAIKSGEDVMVIDGGDVYQGMEAVRRLSEWEMENYLDKDSKVRITHRIIYDRKKKQYTIDLEDSMIDVFGDTP